MRLAFTATLLVFSACDLKAAAIDYGERYCAQSACVAVSDGGEDRGEDGGGSVLRADTALFKGTPEATFVVLRLETRPASQGGGTFTFLEERRLSDGALVGSESLADHGLILSTTSIFHGGLSRAGDGRSVVAMVYEGSTNVSDVRETTVRRVLVLRRDGLDWSTAIADAFQKKEVFSAATHDGSTFWVSGNAGGTESELREVAAGSRGASRFVLRAGPFFGFLSAVGGRLLTSRFLTTDGGLPSGIDDLAVATAPLDVSAPARLVSLTGQQRATGFAALDLNPLVPGLDVLYVTSTVIGPGLRKFVFDGTAWTQAWAVSSETALSPRDGCLHVAARPEDGGVVVLCTAESVNAREVVRFDDFGVGDAGPSPRLLARIEGTGADGGVFTVFRGVAFSPD